MFISAGASKIFTVSFGAKANPAIVGIGGWIGSWELWAEPFSILSQRWRTIAYDHRGAGATVAPPESITFENLVNDVFAVLDAHDVEACVLAAESAGAQTALGAALKRPHRVSGLVLVDGMYFSGRAESDPFLAGLRTAYQPTLDQFVEACVPEAESEHIKNWGRQILARATPESAIALYRSANEVDLSGALSRITQPTLILHGSADSLVPLADAQALADTLPNATLEILKGAGHVPTMTRPAEVAQRMARFLEFEV